MINRMIAVALLLTAQACALRATGEQRPNILWISCEDTSPWLGFCGEKYATTPNLDRLAREGVYYRNAFASAPVCSPCRYAIITGTFATSYGTQRLRSKFDIPDTVKGFPSYLRDAGYYCSNNAKTDYNTSDEKRLIGESWDESSNKAHWRGRKPGQPFFSVFNLVETHQGQAFETTPPKLDSAERHDPAAAPLPPYYPDTPAARRTMACVHDCITAMDRHAGQILAELESDGLKEDTIIFFWPDHGQGLPRGKRTLWDTGLKVPLLVYFPEKYRHLAPAAPGGSCDRLVSLMDFGPTLLSVLGLSVPAHMQGRAFLGKAAAAPRDYVYGARDRVDEAAELSRSVRDSRYLYIRNFMPDLSWNQPEAFSDQLDLRREITQLAASNRLSEAALTYAAPKKPAELLYDTANDPWQMKNLAGDPALRPVLERLRVALRAWQIETRDLGLIHEAEAGRMAAARPLSEAAGGIAYPLERVLDTAWRVGVPGAAAEWAHRLADPDPTVRYWAAVGLRASGAAEPAARSALQLALADGSPSVRVEAAGVLALRFDDRAALDSLAAALADSDDNVQLHAARTLQMLGERARPALPVLRAALPKIKTMFARWSVQGAIAVLTGTESPVFKSSPATAPKPNVLLIISDDQGYGDFGFNGNRLVKTPNLDRLAGESALFRNFAVAAACSPTRAALYTGRDHLLTGVWGVPPRANLQADEVRMPAFFKAAGYRTLHVGKLDCVKAAGKSIEAFGWDDYLGGGGYEHRDPMMWKPKNSARGQGWTADIWTDYTLGYIRSHKEGPWFISLAYIIPHLPWECDEKYSSPFVAQGCSKDLAACYGCIAHLDECIGRLLAGLREAGQEQRTIVVFLSDNGPTGPDSKRAGPDGFVTGADWEKRNVAHLRGHKAAVWENGVRVPCLVRWPGRIAPGERAAFGRAEDLLPTLLDLVGVSGDAVAHKPFSGVSLMPALMSGTADVERPDAFRLAIAGPGAPKNLAAPVERTYEAHHVTLRGARFKYHALPGGSGALYDLAADPGEAADVKDKHPDVASQMAKRCRERWDAVIASGSAFAPPADGKAKKEE